jgi:hypothetical protein
MRKRARVDGVSFAVALGMCVLAAVWTGMTVRRAYSESHRPRTASWKSVRDWRSYALRGHRIGSPDAPVVVVAFIDYECAACRQLGTRLTKLLRKHPGSFALVVRVFPLGFSAAGTIAAVAADCAAKQGAFESMYQALLRSLPDPGRGVWSEYAKSVDVPDRGAWVSCVTSTNPDEILGADLADARRLGVTVVPTLVVNDSAYQGVPWDLEKIITGQTNMKVPRVQSPDGGG